MVTKGEEGIKYYKQIMTNIGNLLVKNQELIKNLVAYQEGITKAETKLILAMEKTKDFESAARLNALKMKTMKRMIDKNESIINQSNADLLLNKSGLTLEEQVSFEPNTESKNPVKMNSSFKLVGNE